jgi:hypothetical protein
MRAAERRHKVAHGVSRGDSRKPNRNEPRSGDIGNPDRSYVAAPRLVFFAPDPIPTAYAVGYLMSPLRGSLFLARPNPTAYAVGYRMSPLRGSFRIPPLVQSAQMPVMLTEMVSDVKPSTGRRGTRESKSFV